MATIINAAKHPDEYLYRVWPDGIVQCTDSEAWPWMSDDYVLVYALDEDHAFLRAKDRGFV